MQVSVVVHISVHSAVLSFGCMFGALGFALRRGGGFTDDKLSGGGGGVTLGQMQDN